MRDPKFHGVTRALPLSDLPSELRNALVTDADKNKLKLIEARAWLTRRERIASKTVLGRLLRRGTGAEADTWQAMALVLHATHLLFASHDSSLPSRVKIVTLPLRTATITASAEGFDVGGHVMMLESGPAAQECLSAVKSAVELAKQPAA